MRREQSLECGPQGADSVPAGGNYFAIDNVLVTTAVPDPVTLTLLGLGMASTIGRARRKQTRLTDARPIQLRYS